MKHYLENEGFYVTYDSDFMNKEHAITEELSDWIDRLHFDVMKEKPGTADRLIKLIKKHPRNPQLKNLLTSYYIITEQPERAYDLNHKTLIHHPDYLFAKLNLVHEYITKEEFEKVQDVLGENFDLKTLYPSRDTFHISEVMAMYKFAVRYHAAVDQSEIAQEFLERMKAIDAADDEVKNASDIIFSYKLKSIAQQLGKEANSRSDVQTNEQIATIKIDIPQFNHPVIEQLYVNDALISNELLDEILTLPRVTLIEDLVKVLNDSIERISFFESEESAEITPDFVFHAMNILGELEAVEALDSILNILKQSKDFIDLFLENYLAEYVWMSIYKLGKNQLDVLENFMKLPNLSTYNRIEISTALAQIAIQQPERREEVIQWYQSVFNFYKEASIEDKVIDSELIGLMISDCVDFDGVELLPIAADLFNLQYVAEDVCGDLDDIENYMNVTKSTDSLREVLSLKEIYQEITTTWSEYNDSEDDFLSRLLNNFENQSEKPDSTSNSGATKPVVSEPKIGRNDPCVCGSGKKYKKCCLVG